MRAAFGLLLLAAFMGGCSGEYILTVPDQVAPAGGTASTVMRLQRNEFAGICPPIKDACIRFQIDKGPVRGAYTDNDGYAAAPVPVGKALGKYYMNVSYIDYRNGRETNVYRPVYVWDARAAAYAVDYDALPMGKDSDKAAAELSKLASNAYILYFTRQENAKHELLHQKLKTLNYPDGPILSWQLQAWHMAPDDKYNVPRLVVENRLISPLMVLRKQFPNLRTGLCSSKDSVAAFTNAGLKVVVIGNEATGPNVVHAKSWGELPAGL